MSEKSHFENIIIFASTNKKTMSIRTEKDYAKFANAKLQVKQDIINSTIQISSLPTCEVVINRKAYDKNKGQTLSGRRAKEIQQIMQVVETSIKDKKLNLKPLKFITITTCQHKENQPDKFFTNYLGDWLRTIENDGYMWTAERQDATNDIHFHILIYCKNIDIKKKLKLLNKHFAGTGTNALNVKSIVNRKENGAIRYLTSYQTKAIRLDKEKNRVFARVSQVSQKLKNHYLQYAKDYISYIPYVDEMQECETIYKTKFCVLKRFNTFGV